MFYYQPTPKLRQRLFWRISVGSNVFIIGLPFWDISLIRHLVSIFNTLSCIRWVSLRHYSLGKWNGIKHLTSTAGDCRMVINVSWTLFFHIKISSPFSLPEGKTTTIRSLGTFLYSWKQVMLSLNTLTFRLLIFFLPRYVYKHAPDWHDVSINKLAIRLKSNQAKVIRFKVVEMMPSRKRQSNLIVSVKPVCIKLRPASNSIACLFD